jgi:hypothetical protein
LGVALGKAASSDNDPVSAKKAWTELLGIEPDGQLAAQAHFGLATLYRKQGSAALAAQEMQEFERLQNAMPPSAEEPSPPPK